MTEIMELFPGITLRCFRDSRFKQGCLSLQFVRVMDKEESAMNALIPNVLLRGTNAHPDLRAVTQRLDELYGAAVSPVVRRIGDYQTLGLYCGFMDDRFALPGEAVLEPMLAFLKELLLDSPLEDGGFLPEFVESEKKNLIATIESERNDKRAYAMAQLLRTMAKEDSFGLPRMGTKEQVAAIDPRKLYDHYRTVLRTSPVHIFYVGSGAPEAIAALLKPLFAGVERTCAPLPAQTTLRDSGGEDVTQTLEVSQGKLCMGFVTSITNRDPEFPAMQLLNTVLGAGMTSKLFMNIREKMSLCYSIGSGYYGTKGIVTVSAGIDFDKEQTVRKEVMRQLDACREGSITPEELENARQALLSSLRGTHDAPGSIEGYYATAALSGMGLTPDAYMAALEAVTPEDVVAAAGTLRLHSTYFLKGGNQ